MRLNRKAERLAQFIRNADAYGVTLEDAHALRRIGLTLQRWAEAECNGDIQREGDQGDGAPYRVYEHSASAKHYPIPDRERGALKRAAGIMKRYPHLGFYHQGDPRGCQVYLVRLTDLDGGKLDISMHYTRGWAVCL